jgi:hypothetical protein
MSRVATSFESLRKQIQEHRADIGFSLRVTAAAVSGFALSHLLHVPLPLWTVLTSVVLTQVSFGRSVKATLDYLAGTLSGALYGGAVAALLPHANDAALAGVLALVVGPLALLSAVNSSFAAATFTGVLVLLVPEFAHVSAVESALNRVIEVAVGGLTALSVSLLLPASARSMAIEAAARMLDQAAASLPDLFAGFWQQRDVHATRHLQDGIGQAFARLDSMVAEARHEEIGFLASRPQLGPLRRTLLRLRYDLIMIGRAAAQPLPEALEARLGPPLASLERNAADYLRRSGGALLSRQDRLPLEAAEKALDDYAEAFAALRRDGLTLGLPVDTVERIFTLGFALDQLRLNFKDLERAVRENARGTSSAR